MQTLKNKFLKEIKEERQSQKDKIDLVLQTKKFAGAVKVFDSLLKSELEKQAKHFPDVVADQWQSRKVRDLMLVTAYIESDFKHIKQIPSGIALSFFQVESRTAKDVYANYAIYRPHFKKLYEQSSLIHKNLREALLNSFGFSLLCARLVYYRQPFSIVDKAQHSSLEDYAEHLAAIHKRYFNTFLGATDVNVSKIKVLKCLEVIYERVWDKDK